MNNFLPFADVRMGVSPAPRSGTKGERESDSGTGTGSVNKRKVSVQLPANLLDRNSSSSSGLGGMHISLPSEGEGLNPEDGESPGTPSWSLNLVRLTSVERIYQEIVEDIDSSVCVCACFVYLFLFLIL